MLDTTIERVPYRLSMHVVCLYAVGVYIDHTVQTPTAYFFFFTLAASVVICLPLVANEFHCLPSVCNCHQECTWRTPWRPLSSICHQECTSWNTMVTMIVAVVYIFTLETMAATLYATVRRWSPK